MILTSINKFQPIWLIIFALISINSVYGQQLTDEVTTISVDNYENNNESNSSGISIPKVQTRFFNWLMNGLNGQSTSQPSGLNGFGGLEGLFRPNPGSNSPFNRFGASLGSVLGANNGFGMQSMGQPPMGPQPMGPPPMGPPPMGPQPMGPQPMGPPPMGPQPMGPQPMGPPLGSQSQFGSPMSSQGGTGSNYGANGQPGQMDDQMGYMSTNDPFGDYGGGDDFFTQIFTFLFGSSGNSSGGGGGGGSMINSNGGSSSGGKGNNNSQGGQKGRPSSGSNSGMSSEDWSNYMKMLQTLYSDGGGAGGGGAGLGDLNAMIGQATSLIQSFQG